MFKNPSILYFGFSKSGLKIIYWLCVFMSFGASEPQLRTWYMVVGETPGTCLYIFMNESVLATSLPLFVQILFGIPREEWILPTSCVHVLVLLCL